MSTTLLSITGDGTFRASRPGPAQGPADDAEGQRLQALERLRSLLGDDLEDGIATGLYLPSALGTEPADHLLPASLSLLAGTTGDLVSYGWRVGPGASRAWLRARELRERTVEDARFALLGYDGPLRLTVLGPATLSAASFVANGERTLADAGARRDLPVLLGEGLAAYAAAVRERVPGARPGVLVREDALGAVVGGRIPTPSGRDRYRALPLPELGELQATLLEALAASGGIAREDVTFAVGGRDGTLGTALTAGAARIAVAPSALGDLSDAAGRRAWESLAQAREGGTAIELVLDASRPDRDLDRVTSIWGRIGYAPADLAGLTWQAHAVSAGSARRDPSAPPPADSLLTEAAIASLLRRAPGWVEALTA